MSTPSLSRRRKQELKEVAQSLGIADDGTREDLVERIKYGLTSFHLVTTLRKSILFNREEGPT